MRWSGFHMNCASPRSKIINPKVVKICDSIGALMMRLITTLNTSTPRQNSNSVVPGNASKGSTCHSVYAQ